MESALQQNLKRKLDDSKITANKLERISGLSSSSVQKILQGHTKKPSIETIKAIARSLNCSVEDLIGEKNINADKTYKWSADLIIPIIKFICQYIDDKKIETDLNTILDITKEIYIYCSGKPEPTFDKEFSKWILEKNFS